MTDKQDKGRLTAIAGSILFLLAAPGVVAGFIPWSISGWVFQPPFFGLELVRIVGWLLIAFGLVLLVETFARFALEGLGTPAPVYPTKTLVVTGSYRFVRNPMYLAVVTLILGQALVFSSWPLLIYAAIVWVVVHLFVVGYEEPTLRHTFGSQYEDYRLNVRRWLPRLVPWNG